MKRLTLLIAAALMPLTLQAVQISPESSEVSPGVLNATDPIVLSFDRQPATPLAATSIRVETGRGLPVSITLQAAGTNIVLRPESAWPEEETLVLKLDPQLRLQGRPYSGPETISLYVRGDEWARLQAAMDKNPAREVKTDGYLRNGIEIYPLPITPNGDGVNDELHITRPGIGFRNPYIRIFSPDGVRVMSVARPGLRNGEVIWDGVDRLGHEAHPGPYFIIIEEDHEILASGVIYVLR